ncbi:unnamed protein product, partial [Pelagomonas calceolata]
PQPLLDERPVLRVMPIYPVRVGHHHRSWVPRRPAPPEEAALRRDEDLGIEGAGHRLEERRPLQRLVGAVEERQVAPGLLREERGPRFQQLRRGVRRRQDQEAGVQQALLAVLRLRPRGAVSRKVGPRVLEPEHVQVREDQPRARVVAPLAPQRRVGADEVPRAPAHQLREAVRVEAELAARERPRVARLRHAPIRARWCAFTPLLQVIYNVRVLGDGDDADLLLEAEVPELRRPIIKEVAVVHGARDDGYGQGRPRHRCAQAKEQQPLHIGGSLTGAYQNSYLRGSGLFFCTAAATGDGLQSSPWFYDGKCRFSCFFC